MPRGGSRKGAGRPSTWASGCKFEDTKIIRVPEIIADKVLEVAHLLDAGEDIDLDTKSIKQENQSLQERLAKCNAELKKLKDDERQVHQLTLNYDSPSSSLPSKSELEGFRDRYLRGLKVGTSARKYKDSKKAIDTFIDKLL